MQEPTYTYPEALAMIKAMDLEGLKLMDWLVHDEKKRYALIEIQHLHHLIETRYRRLLSRK